MVSMARLRDVAAHGMTMSLLVLASACGGGGSSASSAGSNSAPVATTSGLVPTASPLGAVLYPTAATLRPMIDGASWTFHSYDNTGSRATGFRRSQKATAAGVFNETDSDNPNNPTTVSVDASSGQVNISASVSTGLSIANLPINGPELKSPIKANDQLVLLDKHVADIGIDIDKDGKNDAMDSAMYRVIVGNETLLLPNRSKSLTALRVDTTTAIRIIPSGGGSATLTTRVQSTWYALGIGVVKQVLQGATPSAPNMREDFLLGFDGVTTGWGVVTRDVQPLNNGFDGFVPPSGRTLPLTNGVLMSGGNRIFLLDNLGRLVATHSSSDYGLPDTGTPIWTVTSAGPRAIGSAGSSTSRTAVGLYALNADGAPGSRYLGDVDVFSLSPDSYNLGGSLVGASTSGILWGLMTRQSGGASGGVEVNSVVIRRYDTNGNAIGGEITLPSVGQPLTLESQVTATGILLSWADYTPTRSGPANSQAFVGNDGSVSWQTQIPVPSAGRRTMTPLASGTESPWLIWNSTFYAAGRTPQGVSLNADGLPIGVALDANILDNTKLSLIVSPVLLDLWPGLISRQGNDLLAAGSTSYGQAFVGDATKSAFVEMARYSMGAGNPANSMILVNDTVVPGVRNLPVAPFPFRDHTLLLTDDGEYMRSTIIWK